MIFNPSVSSFDWFAADSIVSFERLAPVFSNFLVLSTGLLLSLRLSSITQPLLNGVLNPAAQTLKRPAPISQLLRQLLYSLSGGLLLLLKLLCSSPFRLACSFSHIYRYLAVKLVHSLESLSDSSAAPVYFSSW